MTALLFFRRCAVASLFQIKREKRTSLCSTKCNVKMHVVVPYYTRLHIIKDFPLPLPLHMVQYNATYRGEEVQNVVTTVLVLNVPMV